MPHQRADRRPLRLDAPVVGRQSELAQLRAAFDRAVGEQTSYLFTVIGEAGIGKTRLANEFCSRLGQEARVLAGRCLPYGDGITFWPLREIVQEAFGERSDGMMALLREETDAELIAARIAAAIGPGDDQVAREEIFWAVRKVVEALGMERPLVVILEDIHWAEPTFLDLVEHLADYGTVAPILLLCLARPELLEERPSWGGGKRNATTIYLDALQENEGRSLVADLAGGEEALGRDTRARIIETAGGNPLFIEQMVARLFDGESIEGEAALPPTIQALLAERLDRLGPGELVAIQRAAVVGKEFSGLRPPS